MDIRIATEADIPAITGIYNQAIALRNATADLSPVTKANRSEWLTQHPADSLPVFVADENGKIIGYCSISDYRPGRAALQYTREISYYLHENFRGQGVGSQLIEHALSQCPALNIKTLFAILLDNNPASAALLEKFGFEQWGHMPDVAEIDGTECGHFYYGKRVA